MRNVISAHVNAFEFSRWRSHPSELGIQMLYVGRIKNVCSAVGEDVHRLHILPVCGLCLCL